MDREREIKLLAEGPLDAEPLRAALDGDGLEVQGPREVRQTDAYVDTGSFDLLRRGVGLRVRRGEGPAEVCLKEGGRVEELAATRREVTAAWSRGRTPRRASELPDNLRHEVEPLVWDRELDTILDLHVMRRSFDLRDRASGRSAMLMLDAVRARAFHGAQAAFTEVEIELEDGADPGPWLAAAGRLRSRLALAPAGTTKLERGLRLCGLPARAVSPPGRLRPDLGFRAAAFRTLARRLQHLQDCERRLRAGDEPGGIRRMAAAAERLHAGFELFAPAFTERELEPSLNTTRRILRAVEGPRELEAFLTGIAKLDRDLPENLLGEARRFRGHMDKRWERSRRRLMAWLCASRRLHQGERLQRFLEDGLQGPGLVGPTVAEAAPPLLRERMELLLAKGRGCNPTSHAGDLQACREAARSLHHALAAFREVWPAALGALEHPLQRLLETLDGAAERRAQASWLLYRVDDEGGRLQLLAGAYMGLLGRGARRLREALPPHWERVRGLLEAARFGTGPVQGS